MISKDVIVNLIGNTFGNSTATIQVVDDIKGMFFFFLLITSGGGGFETQISLHPKNRTRPLRYKSLGL